MKKIITLVFLSFFVFALSQRNGADTVTAGLSFYDVNLKTNQSLKTIGIGDLPFNKRLPLTESPRTGAVDSQSMKAESESCSIIYPPGENTGLGPLEFYRLASDFLVEPGVMHVNTIKLRLAAYGDNFGSIGLSIMNDSSNEDGPIPGSEFYPMVYPTSVSVTNLGPGDNEGQTIYELEFDMTPYDWNLSGGDYGSYYWLSIIATSVTDWSGWALSDQIYNETYLHYYSLDEWHSASDSGFFADTTFEIYGDCEESYLITTSSAPAAGGYTSGGGYYSAGSTATVTATANAGYVFQKWIENGTAVSTDATYSFTVTANRDLKAKFKQDGGTQSFTIKATPKPAAGGSVTGAGTYSSGTQITLKAVANAGYVFKNWTEGTTEVSVKKNYKFTVTGNRTLKANFEKETYTINTASAPAAGGTTSGGGNYISGKQITVKAVAASGYVFKNWTEGTTQVSTNKNYKFTVTSNRKLKANFEKATYTINTVSAPAAGGTTSGGGNYISGKQITVKAVAATGYVFSEWLEGGVSVSTNKNYKFTVTGNRTLKAKFVKASNSVQYARTDAGAGKEMKIYPNPFNDYLYINTGDSVPQKALLYDLSGKQIGDYTLGKEPVVRIDTRSVAKGTYVLRIYTDNRVKTFKVIKK